MPEQKIKGLPVNRNELDTSIGFEISGKSKKEVKIKFDKRDKDEVLKFLLSKIEGLREEVEELKSKNEIPTSIKPFKRVWDNESDDIWSEY